MKRSAAVLTSLVLINLAIYLFVNAPPALPESTVAEGESVPVEEVLSTVAAENDIVRALYTQEIVGKGKLVGLAFQDDWREDGIQAGPLPALFLREAAQSLQRQSIPLGLYLGSDFPIAIANKFEGKQAQVFAALKETRKPAFFYAEDTGQYTAMFPDVAGVQGCVTCHNEHKDSPKSDWALNDVMGATTWSYDKAAMSRGEYLELVGAVRQSFRDAYTAYLEKVATFEEPPEIGEKWPDAGYKLPTADAFMAEFARRASAQTVDRLLAETAPPAAEGLR